jgi:serine/threonine protein kinase
MTNRTVNDNIDNADAALAEYMRRTDAGQQINRDLFVAEFPQFADELRDYFAAADAVDRMAGPPLASTVKNAGKSVETHGTSVGDSVSEKSRKTQQSTDRESLPEVFGRYRIEKQLGRGAMGAVYLAKDTQLDRRIALKTPTFDTKADAEMVERFYREARSAANLRHAGICPVFDVGEIDGIHYISMAYIAGRPLSELVNIDKPLPIRTAVSLLRKIALALDHAHEKGVIHRDLKPANIMIDRERQPLIMDFGLARQIDKQDETRLTQDGMILGTPAYMSPEQIEGDLGTGKATDVYSLEVILFELLTGDLPFLGTIAASIGQKMTQDAPPPSEFRKEVDAKLDAICQKMMARQVGNRYASMKELARALSAKSVASRDMGTGSTKLCFPPMACRFSPAAAVFLTRVGIPQSLDEQSTTPPVCGTFKPEKNS